MLRIPGLVLQEFLGDFWITWIGARRLGDSFIFLGLDLRALLVQ